MSDKELIKIVTQFTKGILGNGSSIAMCFAVCSPLQSYLSICGIKTKIIEGEVDTKIIGDIDVENGVWNHFWLELPDGRIIDPTADQFNSETTETQMPRIFLGAKPNYYKIRTDYIPS